ncbi:MAG TPA: D-alanine--D-alanine ligase family protein [Thermoanaerobaculia bacterium]|nr:D-alanine--D-alanine ligase family protein [Thermoanaerobaculia bacterium]
MTKRQRVGVIFGGRSVEHEVSITSARTVARALAEAGHEVVPLGVTPDGCWLDRELSRAALDGRLDALPPQGVPMMPTVGHLLGSGIEVAFPIVHGTWGEDGTLQGLCEMLDLPYVGAGVTASALAMDKLQCKRLLATAGVPVVEFVGFSAADFDEDAAACLSGADVLPLPLFVKPSIGGSSVGVQKVGRREGLEPAVRHALRFDDHVLIERGIAGRELECSVLGYRPLEASAVGEIQPAAEFYDYADKYLDDAAGLVAPAELDAAVEREVRRLAVAAFAAIGGWGMARVDFLLEGDTPYVNEINTVPGFTRISMYPRLWGVSGVPLPELVDRLVAVALERHGDRRRLDQGIKEWLQELAAKRSAG